MLLLISGVAASGSLTISAYEVNFNGSGTQTVIVSGGTAPYTAVSSDDTIASVAQGPSPNKYPNADSLSTSTLTGLTKATGGPNGATDAEYTGTGSQGTANESMSDTVSVTAGQTYILSGYIDPSAITNNNGSLPNIGTEFPGSTQNADGSWSGVSGSSSTKYALTTGTPFTVAANIAKADTTQGAGLIIGNTTSGYGVTTDGTVNVVRYSGGYAARLGNAAQPVSDTNYHNHRLSATPGTPNVLQGAVDDVVINTTDTAGKGQPALNPFPQNTNVNREGVITLVPADGGTKAVSFAPAFSSAITAVGFGLSHYSGTDNPRFGVQVSSDPSVTGFTVIVNGGQSGSTVSLHYRAIGDN